jgi:outer membrane protein assembly factor BamB
MDPQWGVSLPGPESAPAVVDGRLVVGANDRALAFALGAEDDGQRLWEREYEGGLSAGTAPVLAGETVYAVTESPPDGAARLRALERESGEERWNAPMDRPVRPLAFTEHVLVPAGDGLQVRRAGDGRVVGRRAVRGRLDSLLGGEVRVGEPAAIGARLYLPYEDAAGAHWVAAVNEGVQWRHETEGRVLGLAVAGGTLVVTTGRGVEAVETTSGERRWGATPGRSHTPVLAGEVVVAHTDGELSAFDTRGGTLEWTVEGSHHPLALASERLYTYEHRAESSGLVARDLGSGDAIAGWGVDGSLRGVAIAERRAVVVTNRSLTVYA